MLGCLSAPPGSSRDGGASDGGGAQLDPALIGNLLFLTFDDYQPPNVYRDHSGNAFHAYPGYTKLVEGVTGQGVNLRPSAGVQLPDMPGSFSTSTTIEMWVRAHGPVITGHLFGDGDSRIETLVHVVDGAVTFSVNPGIDIERETITCSQLTLPPSEWIHVAVTWDGQVVRFYGDAEPLCEVDLVDQRLEQANSGFYVGDFGGIDADIDELKVSTMVKSQEDLARSRDYDSSQLIDVCGDGFVVNGASDCEIADPCCSSSCQLLTDQPCSDEAGNSGLCSAGGLCNGGGDGRVSGTLALYLFDDSTDGIVRDVSGHDVPADLSIVAPAAVTQMSGYLILDSATGLVTDQSLRIVEQLIDASEVTMEAWVRPARTPQEELPRRIVTLSDSLSDSNMTLGQAGSAYVTRVRYAQSSQLGEPVTSTGPDSAGQDAVDHVVTTFSGTTVRSYLNGRLVDVSPRLGGLERWTNTARLQIGNEVDPSDALLGREWLGNLHLIAIYDRALSSVEVVQNYLVGPDPEL